jgi:DNA mismatch endonuclease, patch repair protein
LNDSMPPKKTQPAVPGYANYRPRNDAASRVGAGNRRQNTIPEVLLRRALRMLGFRYRSNVKRLPGCPDVALIDHRVAVFCDGDFWHGRFWSRRKAKLAAGWNADYWVAKIQRNRQRDRSMNRVLRQLGWHVIRVWETDVRRDADRVARRIRNFVNRSVDPVQLRDERSTS